jgi:hypothetical protein
MKIQYKHILFLSILFYSVSFNSNAEGLDDQIILESTNTERVKPENIFPDPKPIDLTKTTANTTGYQSEILFIQKIPPVVAINKWMLLVQNQNKDYKKIEENLKNGQNINDNVMDGNTMLILGAMQNNIEEVKFALKHKANIYLTNNEGDTALHWAVSTGNVDMVKLILDSATDKKLSDYINKKDKLGRTALHFASMYKSNSVILNMLLLNHADINSVDLNGQTPAHFAGAYDQWDNLDFLIKKGCNLSLKDHNDILVEYFILTRATFDYMIHFYPYLTNNGKQRVTDINGYKQ